MVFVFEFSDQSLHGFRLRSDKMSQLDTPKLTEGEELGQGERGFGVPAESVIDGTFRDTED